MKTFKSFHCKYRVLCLDKIDENTFICCCSEKNKNIIKQYRIDKSNFEIKEISQKKNKNNDEILKIQKINEKIFFIDNQKSIIFFV